MTQYFKVTTDKSPLSYTCGEPMVFTVEARSNHMSLPCPLFRWEFFGDDGHTSSGTAAYFPGRPVRLEASCSVPGFVHLVLTALTAEGEPDPAFDVCDAGAGADVASLSYHGKLPADWDAYWKGIEEWVSDSDPRLLSKVPYTRNVPDWCDCWDIKVSTPLDTPASGYMSIPHGEGPFHLIMEFRGYALDGAIPFYQKDAICICFNAHGLENGFTRAAMEEKYPHLKVYGFDREENARPETCYWQNMMVRNLVGAKWAKTLPQWDGKVFIARGGSQAALQATTLAAHDRNVSLLDAYIPWFCDLHAEEAGYLGGWRPLPDPGLEYFDTVTQAMHVSCPVQIHAYLGDYICPPSTIMAMYNAIPGRKKLTFTQSGTHGYRPPEIDSVHLQYDPANPENSIRPGVYRHYKGGEYQFLCTGRDSETGEEVVIYRALYEDGTVWSRPRHMWDDLVAHDHRICSRFTWVRED